MLSQFPAPAEDIQSAEMHPQSEVSPSQSKPEHLPHPLQRKPVDQHLASLWNTIITTADLATFCSAIKEYCLLIVNCPDEDIFVSYFIEKKFMSMLKIKINEWKAEGDILRTVFSLFEFLLKALKKDVQLIYFLVKLSQEGFITSDYVFKEEEDEAYYANFLKLMIRKINEDSKFLSVFFNSREPQFPLLLQLLRMHDCKDTIMHTSSKLAILQISNNPTPLVQSYMHNFPFVLFYPLYVVRVTNHLKQYLVDEDSHTLEHLQSSLKYLEDFSEGKERAAIDMYTNSFLCIVGKYIYEELTTINEKTFGKAIKLLKGLWTKIIREISVVKVRIALLCLFAPLIPSRMKRCFEAKSQQLESKYWIPQACSQQLEEHCRTVFYKQEPQSRSFLRSINSYIPRSKDNWLYHELKKISAIIGYDITLNEPISVEKPQKESFLWALQTLIDDETVFNPLFASVMKTQSEELLYYYLRVLSTLSECQEAQTLIELDAVIQFTATCTSLSLLQALHSLVSKLSFVSIKLQYIQQVYSKVIQKLTHFVLTKGWAQLLARVKETRLPEDEEPFLHDIYRQLECDILLFVTLRTLLGTQNSQCSKFQGERWTGYPAVGVETTFKCKDSSKFGPLIYAILDGQFLLLKNTEEQLINKKELLVTDLQIYEDGELIQIVANGASGNFCITLHLDKEVRQYFLREVANRKQLTQKVTLELKQLYFPLNYS